MSNHRWRTVAALVGAAVVLGGVLAGAAEAGAQESWAEDEEQGAARQLLGLWSAERNFGPEIRGQLTLREVGKELWAEIGGYSIEADKKEGEIRFEVPGGRGYFRGGVSSTRNRIEGHWVQPWNYRSFARMASPVSLSRTAEGAWSGTVTPLEDRLRFFLVIEKDEEGRIGAFLRNPEANIGRFYRIQKIVGEPGFLEFLDAEGRVRLEGRYDARFGRLSIYFPLNGGTYDFVRADDDTASLFFPRPKGSEPYTYRRPEAGEGWQVSRPKEVGMAIKPLEKMIRRIIETPMDGLEAPYIHGVLVARHGKLVLEEYFHGYSRWDVHGTRSASKSMTTTLVGIAAHEGILSLDTPVYETMFGEKLPKRLDPRAERMKLGHLITMTSGLACDDGDEESPGGEDRMQSQDEQPDWARYTLALPMVHEPGEHAAYCSGGQNLAGAVLSRVSGEWLPEFYRRHFAAPVGSGVYHMNLTPTGEGYGGGGLFIRPRDFLKLGQIYLDDGVWKGRRLLDSGWAEEATTTERKIRDEGYGYGWWTFWYPLEHGEVKAFYAGGNGGQYVIVVPELDLNVVIFGGNYNQRVMHDVKYEYVREYVLGAIAGE